MEPPYYEGVINKEGGQAALTTVVLLLFVSLAIGGGVSAIALKESRISKINTHAKESYVTAESGVEDVLYRVKKNKNYSATETLTLNNAAAVTTVTNIGAQEKKIIAQGDSTKAIRNVDVRLRAGAGVSFFYGVEVGNGGLEMESGSHIEGARGALGNVYVNGPVAGDSGATITGDLISAGTIDDVVVFGNASAAAIGKDAEICGNAFTPTIHTDALKFLNTPKKPPCPDPLTPGSFTAATTPTSLPMPISADQIQKWKKDAGCGTQPPTNPLCLYDGNYALTQNTSLGPLTIAGDLLMKDNNKTLTMSGTLYVKGNIDIDNGSTIRCGASYADTSCIVIADGWIHVKNNGAFAGSGTPGSYLMLLSALACDGSSAAPPCDIAHHHGAIDLHNNAAGAIFYASDGLINLHNNVSVTELTGYKIHLDNNAIVTYETGLANMSFSSGPTGGWEIIDWREVK